MSALQRSAWGSKRRAGHAAEADQARTFEQLLLLHGLEWWHVNLPMRSRAGFPDYEIYGDAWIAWVELKARSLLTGKVGKLTPVQRAFHARIERGGGEVRVFRLPDDWDEVDSWLCAKTGRSIRRASASGRRCDGVVVRRVEAWLPKLSGEHCGKRVPSREV